MLTDQLARAARQITKRESENAFEFFICTTPASEYVGRPTNFEASLACGEAQKPSLVTIGDHVLRERGFRGWGPT